MKSKLIAVASITVLICVGVGNSVACTPTTVYDLPINSTVGGTVTTLGEGTRTYDEGIVVNLVAEAEEGYRFVEWTGDVGIIANVNAAIATITMNGDYSITANFEQEENIMIFPDLNLEAAIREAIGKPKGPIYPSDLEGLTSLDAMERNISDHTGLEHCTSLTELYLGYNQISDISALVDNPGLGEGDEVNLGSSTLSDDSINIYILQLQARGVIVQY